jgi:hypothetical protein
MGSPMKKSAAVRNFASLNDYLVDWGNQGKTQAEFAAHFGISVGYLSDLKNGKVTPSAALMKRFRDECRISVDSFLGTIS